MKICFLNKNLDEKCGAGRFSQDIINSISSQKDIETTSLTEEGGTSKNFPNFFISILKIRKCLKRNNIIHVLDGYPYGIMAALANVGLNKKLVISAVGTYSVLPLDQKIKGFLLRWAYRRADKIICISRFTEEQILKRVKLKNTIVITPGIDIQKFTAPKISANKNKMVLSVGALKPRKGYHISIPAMAEVVKKYPDLKYYIVGGKPAKIYLDLVKEYNLENNIKFFENISDQELTNLYHQANIFLLTPITINENDFEGFGLVYLEAGACGKAVIGTFGCGAEDAIDDAQTGILVQPNNIKETAQAIIKLLDNPVLTAELGQNGQKKAQQESWSNVIKKYIKVYEEN